MLRTVGSVSFVAGQVIGRTSVRNLAKHANKSNSNYSATLISKRYITFLDETQETDRWPISKANTILNVCPQGNTFR